MSGAAVVALEPVLPQLIEEPAQSCRKLAPPPARCVRRAVTRRELELIEVTGRRSRGGDALCARLRH